MLFRFLDYYYRTRPILLGRIFKLLFANKRLVIGKNFQCDSIPKILINGKAVLEIGDNVIFRRNVELRAHHDSKIEIGNNCRIDRGVRLLSTNEAKLVLKDGVRVGLYSVFNGGDSILVGDKTLISGFVYLQTSMHNYHKADNIQEQGYAHAPIALGKDNWVGTQAIIFPGV
ncbi:MAG: hypothetical protein AAFO82_15725, partial [Bacteroidota bacterium]